ncbi:MAG: hypothetical protein M3Z46_02855, partial [Actinomycetota bacterium]|nr:hypothetical protein [Actinomycetota bacterium]
MRIPGPPASITNLLFTSADNGGVGSTKLELYSPRNGFRLFPADPVRFSGRTGGSRPDWTSLNQFPTGRPGVIACRRDAGPTRQRWLAVAVAQRGRERHGQVTRTG